MGKMDKEEQINIASNGDFGISIGVCTVSIVDEIHRVNGLLNAISLLKNTDHKEYRFDPMDDLLIVINEKLDFIEQCVEEL